MLDRISIDLSNYCTKQCDFCYNHSTKEGNVLWTVEELIPFILDLHEHGIEAVSFGGGEPFEFDGIFKLISSLMSEMYVSVTSNGLPLEKESVLQKYWKTSQIKFTSQFIILKTRKKLIV